VIVGKVSIQAFASITSVFVYAFCAKTTNLFVNAAFIDVFKINLLLDKNLDMLLLFIFQTFTSLNFFVIDVMHFKFKSSIALINRLIFVFMTASKILETELLLNLLVKYYFNQNIEIIFTFMIFEIFSLLFALTEI
jgi:hypothetical protein